MHERGIATLQVCGTCGRCYDHNEIRCPADGADLVDAARPLPYRLLDRYRLVQLLGEGGMGIVFAAHDEKLGRDVAVKLIRPEHWTNTHLRQRFEREARTVARIRHPGVIDLHDSGELEDGTAFLVMERLAGCDLGLLLTASGRGTPRQVASLVRQGCAALGAAHRAGVVHRDVKPENVFLVDDAGGFRVKLLDFGVAKTLKLGRGLTYTGMIVGTPAYMPPEQMEGEDVDTRADVYSFAAVAYESLTGRRAISASSAGRAISDVFLAVPPPVSALLPDVPAEVDAAFAAALAKDPARRPADIETWGAALAELLERMAPQQAVPGWPPGQELARLKQAHIERGPTLLPTAESSSPKPHAVGGGG